MRPARFEYLAPTNIENVIRALDQPDAMVLAGGQSLIAAMNTRKARPRVLVDINRTEGLAGREALSDYIRLGAILRHSELEKDTELKAQATALADAAALVGDPAIRRRGTLGGSLAHADPGAHLPAAALLLDAEVELSGRDCGRIMKVAQFLRKPFRTAIRSPELLVAVRVPPSAPGQSSAFRESATRSQGTRICAGTIVELDELGACARVRVVLTGIGPKPWCLADAAGDLSGERWSTALPYRQWADWLLDRAETEWGHLDPERRQLTKDTVVRSMSIAWQRNSNARRP